MRGLSHILLATTIAYLALPIVGLILQLDYTDLNILKLGTSLFPALQLSLATAIVSTFLLVLFGTPLAWWLSQKFDSRPPLGIQVLIHWPLVIPPSVLGLALLDTYGAQGILQANVAFTPSALILIQTIVAAPLYLHAALSSFASTETSYIDVARTLGASPTLIAKDIVWPLHRWSLLGGASLAFARALGEFGATLIFAGNLPGTTQTMPLAIYEFLETDLNAARLLALLLLGIALTLIVSAYRFRDRSGR